MGQKVDPRILRTTPNLGNKWESSFFSISTYRDILIQDYKIRTYINHRYSLALLSKINIDRPSSKKIVININSARPGVIIGKSGVDIHELKKEIASITKMDDIYINILEIKKPDLDAKLLAFSIARQLEKRVSYRKALKKSIQSAMKNGAKGIRISCSGRLGGAEIARSEWYREGRVPLHTLRASIDYAKAEAITTYGVIGLKVWVYKGDIENRRSVGNYANSK
jgi:small subunit ribosomal protein S3